MALLDPSANGNGKKVAYGLYSYRSLLLAAVSILLWLANQIWEEALEIKHDVKGYALQLTDHATRIDRAEQDIRDNGMRINTIDSRLSKVEGSR